jgi:hypothetical protein
LKKAEGLCTNQFAGQDPSIVQKQGCDGTFKLTTMRTDFSTGKIELLLAIKLWVYYVGGITLDSGQNQKNVFKL